MQIKPGHSGACLSRYASAWASDRPVDWSACSADSSSLLTGREASGRLPALFSIRWEARGSHV